MTLGDLPNLSIHAHPVTRKVWMYKKPVRTFYTDPIYDGGETEIFEDGTIVVFDEDGMRVYSRKFNSQDSAINYLKTFGWKLRR